MVEDIGKKIYSIKIPYKEVNVIWTDVQDLIKKFKQNVDAYIETKNVHFLVLADQNSLAILKGLVDIVKKLEKINDKTGLIETFRNFTRLVRKQRQELGLKI